VSNATRQITDLETIKVGDYVYAFRPASEHRKNKTYRLIKVVSVYKPGFAGYLPHYRVIGTTPNKTKRYVYTDSFFWTYFTPSQADIEKFEAKVKELASAPTPIER
jgi:hypothetical protein